MSKAPRAFRRLSASEIAISLESLVFDDKERRNFPRIQV